MNRVKSSQWGRGWTTDRNKATEMQVETREALKAEHREALNTKSHPNAK